MATVAAALVAVFISAAGALRSRRLRKFIYWEWGYKRVLEQASIGVDDPVELMVRLLSYTHDNLIPGGGPVVDKGPWNDLVRGIAWCDQQGTVGATLLARRGIDARLLYLYPPEGPGNHTVLEVLLGERWVVVDPFAGLVFREPQTDALLSLRELRGREDLLLRNPRYLQLPSESAILRGLYQGIFLTPQKAVAAPSVLSSWPRAPVRDAVHLAIRLADRWVGSTLSALYQDFYFRIEYGGTASAQSPTARWEMARGYELYGRIQEAARGYAALAAEHPETAAGRRSNLLLRKILLRRGDAPGARDALVQFVRLSEGQQEHRLWLAAGYHYLGAALRLLGAPAEAHRMRAAAEATWGSSQVIPSVALARQVPNARRHTRSPSSTSVPVRGAKTSAGE